MIAWVMLIPKASSFSTLISYFTFAAWVFYGATIAGLLYMKITQSSRSRPFKVMYCVIKFNSFKLFAAQIKQV